MTYTERQRLMHSQRTYAVCLNALGHDRRERRALILKAYGKQRHPLRRLAIGVGTLTAIALTMFALSGCFNGQMVERDTDGQHCVTNFHATIFGNVQAHKVCTLNGKLTADADVGKPTVTQEVQ